MNLFIGIMSYPEASRNGMNDAVRHTWLRNCPYHYKFFLPVKACQEDEVETSGVDSYEDYWTNAQPTSSYTPANGYDYPPPCDRTPT